MLVYNKHLEPRVI